jgi:putative endonuclease
VANDNSNILTGKKGEDSAFHYLSKKGYTILEQNYRYKRAEIDLIAQKDNTLVFVEVKTRKNNHFGEGEEFVSTKKIDLYHLTAEHYIEENNWQGETRFDIIALNNSNGEIHHIEDAFH